MAISAYHLLRKNQPEFFRTSLRIGLTCALIASLLAAGTGHLQAQHVAKAQPMKLAVMESLWETANPAPYLLFASIDQNKQQNSLEISVPGALSLLVHGSLDGEIKGIKELQAQYAQQYGPGNYVPDIFPVFWSYRIMIGAGMWLLALTAFAFFQLRQNRVIDRVAKSQEHLPVCGNSKSRCAIGWQAAIVQPRAQHLVQVQPQAELIQFRPIRIEEVN